MQVIMVLFMLLDARIAEDFTIGGNFSFLVCLSKVPSSKQQGLGTDEKCSSCQFTL